MSELEKAEQNLAEALKQLPLEKAVTIVCGAVAIAFGDEGLKALCHEGHAQIEHDEDVVKGMR
ncbi:hypothetical protein [Limibacillus halophilus]|jgi:hypothetical protein